MPTKTSNATGGGLWTAGTTWAGGVAPVDGDTVVIAAGDSVEFDDDHSAYTTGIAGITVTSHATTPATLFCTQTAGSYCLMLADGSTVVGTNATLKGLFKAGTSLATPLPQDVKFKILHGTTGGTTGGYFVGQYLDIELFCTEPTIKYVQLTSANIATDTVLNVDQDVTADATRPWEVGDVVLLTNAVKSGTRTAEFRTISAVTSTTITLSSGLGYALPQYSIVTLVTRNIRNVAQGKPTGTRYLFDLLARVEDYQIHTEMFCGNFTGSSGGSIYATRATNGWWSAFRTCSLSGGGDTQLSVGGVIVGLNGSGGNGNAASSGFGESLTTVFCCMDTCLIQNFRTVDMIAVSCQYPVGSRIYGKFTGFCNAFNLRRCASGSFNSDSRIEWSDNGVSVYSTGTLYWDGTIANCGGIGGSNAYLVFGPNSRMGSGCNAGYTQYAGVVRGYGTRFNHGTPVSSYGNYQDPWSSVVMYDYSDSSDVPQYGQIRAWMGAGTIAPDTGTVTGDYSFTHKMSHEYTGGPVYIDIPLVLEAGTPLAIEISVKLNSGAYSWTDIPTFELIYSGSNPHNYGAEVVASAVDSNGDPVDETSSAWQTLYLKYTLPIAANRPLGAKQNFILRARAKVADNTGTPYWHWNYTQNTVVNANIQYVNGYEVGGDGQSGTEWGPA